MIKDLSSISIDSLSKFLNIASDDLLSIVQIAPKSYNVFTKSKKNGKLRIIEAPHEFLKKIQRDLLDKIFFGLSVDSSFFCRKGSSAKMAIKNHVGKPVVITMDIADFFPSVKSCMVRGMLISRGASKDLACLLTRLLTFQNHLAQGSPASPCVAKLVLNKAAINIRKALEIIPRSESSIYVDDLTISGPAGIKRFKNTIIKIFEREKFKINPDKINIMPDSEEQESLGVRLNDKLEPTKEYLNKYEKLRQELGDSDLKVKGMKAYIASLNR